MIFSFWMLPFSVRTILSLVTIIVIVIILFRFRASKNPHQDSLTHLKKRLERGEITKEEYEEARKRRGR
ncbi:MAG TPA: SHOCT domain-containing protein [Bacillota bacterium]|nr:SHOCT domain-containing protein [Bacillota bacterium]